MDINEAIAQVEHDLAHTLQELADTRDLLAMLEDGRKKLELELHGLRSFAQRAGEDSDSADVGGPRPTADTPRGMRAVTSLPSHADVVPISDAVPHVQLASTRAAAARASLATMSRTDAVLAVLRAASSPIDRSTIVDHLFDGGRDDTLDKVSLTLSGLKRSNRVERLGKGLWQIVVAPAPRSSSEPDRLHSIEN